MGERESAEKISKGKARIVVFASGGGTNFQELVNGSKKGEIDGEIVALVSNKPDALALTRAQNHGIPQVVVSSKERLKDQELRREFEEELFRKVEALSPDIIVLAGWMVVLSDDFVQKAQELEIPIINLHPALLTEGNKEKVTTALGKVPVIRGTHAIKEAYDQNLKVSGVTVHQVVPGPFDTGPIILQEEVYRVEGETLEEWEERIHEVEHRLLPMAVQKIIRTMKNG